MMMIPAPSSRRQNLASGGAFENRCPAPGQVGTLQNRLLFTCILHCSGTSSQALSLATEQHCGLRTGATCLTRHLLAPAAAQRHVAATTTCYTLLATAAPSATKTHLNAAYIFTRMLRTRYAHTLLRTDRRVASARCRLPAYMPSCHLLRAAAAA